MAPAVAERAFEPFFTTRPVGEGTGLGLASVQRAMTSVGGTVRLDSTVGEGTSVHLYFATSDDQPAASHTAAEPSRKGTGRVVLIVEDQPGVRELAARVLEDAGYTVVRGSDADNALALLERHEGPLDLVLSDVAMPGLTGVELAAVIRSGHPDTPVAFMSGHAPDLEDAGESVLAKPFTREALLTFIDQALSR
jgi:CheY-like chemotaxis protein